MRGPFLVAKVAVCRAAYSFDSEYSYIIPSSMTENVKEGVRVLVPFGKANRRTIGFVTRTYLDSNFNEALKPIVKVLDENPLLNEELLRLVFWLKENTFCTFFDAYKTMVPTGFTYVHTSHFTLVNGEIDCDLTEEEQKIVDFMTACKNQTEIDALLDYTADKKKKVLVEDLVDKGIIEEKDTFKRKVGDSEEKMVRLSDDFINKTTAYNITQKQSKVVKLLEDCGCASVKEVCYMTNSTPTLIKRLVTNNVLDEYSCEIMRDAIGEITQTVSPDDIILSSVQHKAYEGITALCEADKPAGALLYGVTGSGKTSVFIKLIDAVVKKGKSAIMLVPEISLTPQMVSKFKMLFGNSIAVVHSSLSLGQRVDEFKRIRNGDAKIVIGTRSAIFAPVKNLGLIIMDEEGEHTYKSESSPRYHARDVAIQRCGFNNCVLLMASATPSLESYYFAQKNRYSLFELPERYSDAVLPDVKIVDMQNESAGGNDSALSRELADRIQQNLDNSEQTILLLNRRGFHTYVSCMDCKKPVECPNCSLPLTYHKKNNRLMCHYCGYSMNNVDKCPSCGSTKLHTGGVGTQKIETEISRMYPDARILRMDADTTTSRYSYEQNFSDFENGKYDIMLGTQMIAKGLNFPNVTCVGVISLDKALFTGDFRSYERTFSLITQVCGRSGRGSKPGVAYIQTFVPDHYVINLASQQDYNEFYEQEIALRQALIYPPFCDVCVVGFSAELESATIKGADFFTSCLKTYISENTSIKFLRVLGPAPCTLERINGRYRYRLILKCKNNKDFRDMMKNLLMQFYKNKDFSNVRIFADINGDIGL